MTLLPGFIDTHTHIIGRILGDPLNDLAIVKDYASYGAIAGVANARAFAGQDYDAYHTFMALAPALRMAGEL